MPTVEPEGLSDPEVLELTAAEGRVLVTASLRDFEPISREWALAATDTLAPRTGCVNFLTPRRMRADQ
ncbi:MAG: hypothetical protein ACJ732_09940 [Rubrobacteraceae bacterium]